MHDDLGWKNRTTQYNCRFSATSLALRVIGSFTEPFNCEKIKVVTYIYFWIKFFICYDQGRLLHINDGANAPWKKYGEAFLQKLRGKCINY